MWIYRAKVIVNSTNLSLIKMDSKLGDVLRFKAARKRLNKGRGRANSI